MMFSKLTILAQMGSALRLAYWWTLIVRSLLMPSIATLLGRWFWWPQVGYPRGDNHFLNPQPRTPVPVGAGAADAPTTQPLDSPGSSHDPQQ